MLPAVCCITISMWWIASYIPHKKPYNYSTRRSTYVCNLCIWTHASFIYITMGLSDHVTYDNWDHTKSNHMIKIYSVTPWTHYYYPNLMKEWDTQYTHGHDRPSKSKVTRQATIYYTLYNALFLYVNKHNMISMHTYCYADISIWILQMVEPFSQMILSWKITYKISGSQCPSCCVWLLVQETVQMQY